MPDPTFVKITRPKLSGIAPRDRLFRLLDKGRGKPVVWVGAPAGSGKTTLVASYLDARRLPCLWYQVDAGDGDIASFFYYMGLAGANFAPRQKKPLPLLTPEYLQSVPVFTRRYFEELFRRVSDFRFRNAEVRPNVPARNPGSSSSVNPQSEIPDPQSFAVVLDNYQDAPEESGFHEMIAHALETVPEGITVFILSRGTPPAQLARLRANNKLSLLGWEDVRFTLPESRELVKTGGRKQFRRESLELLYKKTEGWAAALVLLMERTAGGGIGAHDLDHLGSAGVFDYFANEIFDKSDSQTQRFLLMTAFLPDMTAAMAEQLTGYGEAGAILEQLNKRHYFTDKHAALGNPVYQYHALFREFLLARSKSCFDAAERLSIKRKAVDLLLVAGRRDDAALLVIEAKDWTALVRLILGEAHVMTAQGRCKTVEGWIFAVPEDIRNKNAWLLYWSGICRMAFDPHESRRSLERSFARFKAAHDAAGMFLSWASIVDTFTYAWDDFTQLDRWIAVMDGLLQGGMQLPSPEIEVRVAAGMLGALVHRKPWRPDLPRWADRVQRIVLTSTDAHLRMAFGNQLILYLLLGDLSRAAIVHDSLRPSGRLKGYDPLTRQYWYVMEAMYSWLAADWKTCLRSISDGIKNADESGIHLLDLYLLSQGIYGGVSLGDPSAVTSCMERILLIDSPRRGDKAHYHYQASTVAWYQGDLKRSAEHGKQAVRICEEMGWLHAHVLSLIDLSITLFDDGKHDEADSCLAKAMAKCRGMNSHEFHGCLTGAGFAFERGKKQKGMFFLKRGLSLGARFGFLNTPRWNDARMSRLCAKALEQGIETDYVRLLIKKRNLIPPSVHAPRDRDEERGPAEHAIWPYPVRIYTRGRFEIVKEGKPLTFSGKVQKKPLELLRAVVALGGANVPEERLWDMLWPDAEGDMAHQSFATTLKRLRRLLGDNRAVVLKRGCLTINPQHCWVDVLSGKTP